MVMHIQVPTNSDVNLSPSEYVMLWPSPQTLSTSDVQLRQAPPRRQLQVSISAQKQVRGIIACLEEKLEDSVQHARDWLHTTPSLERYRDTVTLAGWNAVHTSPGRKSGGSDAAAWVRGGVSESQAHTCRQHSTSGGHFLVRAHHIDDGSPPMRCPSTLRCAHSGSLMSPSPYRAGHAACSDGRPACVWYDRSPSPPPPLPLALKLLRRVRRYRCGCRGALRVAVVRVLSAFRPAGVLVVRTAMHTPAMHTRTPDHEQQHVTAERLHTNPPSTRNSVRKTIHPFILTTLNWILRGPPSCKAVLMS